MNLVNEINLCDFKFINRDTPQIIVPISECGMEALIRGEEKKVNEDCWLLTLSNNDWLHLEKKEINYLITDLWEDEIDMFIAQDEESAIFGKKDLLSASKKLEVIIDEHDDKCKRFLTKLSFLLEKAVIYNTCLTINIPIIK